MKRKPNDVDRTTTIASSTTKTIPTPPLSKEALLRKKRIAVCSKYTVAFLLVWIGILVVIVVINEFLRGKHVVAIVVIQIIDIYLFYYFK